MKRSSYRSTQKKTNAHKIKENTSNFLIILVLGKFNFAPLTFTSYKLLQYVTLQIYIKNTSSQNKKQTCYILYFFVPQTYIFVPLK